MKPSLTVPATSLRLPKRDGIANDTWFDQLTAWLPRVFETLERKVPDEERPQYNDELVGILGTLAGFEYLARGERDLALAMGFEKYPKGSCNADEQIALARKFATHEDRLHKLLKELHDAARTRLSVNQTNINFLRQQYQTLANRDQ